MYKCKNNECSYKLKDYAVTGSNAPGVIRLYNKVKNECPLCSSELEYVNELLLKTEKYKKSMNLK